MPRHSSPGWVPKYRHHKSSGHAFVAIAGNNHFLGKFNSPESKEKYDRLIAEWLTRHRRTTAPDGGGAGTITITELVLAYRVHAEATYPPTTVAVMKAAMRYLRSLYGHLRVREFTPLCFKAVQGTMVAAKDEDGKTAALCRATVNDYSARIRHLFKWGVAEGFVPPAVWQGLTAVSGLRRGRSTARETEPVGPVSDDHVEATLKELPPVIGDMVRLQRLTGMRPGELCRLRPTELEMGGDVWLYKPSHHKTKHHGKDRVIPIGPKAQAILTPHLRKRLDAPVFRPSESERVRGEALRQKRTTPMTPSQIERDRLNAERGPRFPADRGYSVASYRRAVARAAERAGVPEWSPNQLRHARATELRRTHGLDGAGAVLGHSKLETTQVYAERSVDLATEIARKTG